MCVMEKKPTKKDTAAVIELLKQYNVEYRNPRATANYKMNKAVGFFEGNPSKMEQVISLLEAMNND